MPRCSTMCLPPCLRAIVPSRSTPPTRPMTSIRSASPTSGATSRPFAELPLRRDLAAGAGRCLVVRAARDRRSAGRGAHQGRRDPKVDANAGRALHHDGAWSPERGAARARCGPDPTSLGGEPRLGREPLCRRARWTVWVVSATTAWRRCVPRSRSRWTALGEPFQCLDSGRPRCGFRHVQAFGPINSSSRKTSAVRETYTVSGAVVHRTPSRSQASQKIVRTSSDRLRNE